MVGFSLYGMSALVSCITLHLYSTPQHVVFCALSPGDGIYALGHPGHDLCTILQTRFREKAFHALR